MRTIRSILRIPRSLLGERAVFTKEFLRLITGLRDDREAIVRTGDGLVSRHRESDHRAADLLNGLIGKWLIQVHVVLRSEVCLVFTSVFRRFGQGGTIDSVYYFSYGPSKTRRT